jgi:peptidoglycan/LPS O-acetylase OafA/YrhL
MSSSNFDILRAIAVGAMLLAHVFRFFGNEHLGPLSAWELGMSGVLMFFVHTALVLMMSMERMSLANLTDVPAFYVRRAARIYRF